jgi:hypothetical protein
MADAGQLSSWKKRMSVDILQMGYSTYESKTQFEYLPRMEKALKTYAQFTSCVYLPFHYKLRLLLYPRRPSPENIERREAASFLFGLESIKINA